MSNQPIDEPSGRRAAPVRVWQEFWRGDGPLLLVIAAGGAMGASARYGLAQWLPVRPGRFPWTTFGTNVLGCFLLGVLMVAVTEIWAAHRLARPFLGVGVLGGFTTFSTYVNEIRELLRPGTVAVALGYLAGTLLCALTATFAAIWLTRAGYERLRRARRAAA